MANINNVPAYANEYPFIVAVGDPEDLWFYGAYDDLKFATEVAKVVNGIVISR